MSQELSEALLQRAKQHGGDKLLEDAADALRAVEGDAARNAYNTLHALTKPGTYGRGCIEALRHLALGDESPEAKDYCPFCLSWLGGPLICCDDWMTSPTWEPITKSEAERRRPLPDAPLDAAGSAEGVD